MPRLITLKKRPEFLAIRGGQRASCAAFVLETKKALSPEGAPPRFGFTVTKKLGNAVIRNRIRRRLKAAVTAILSSDAKPGHDYVVIARTAAETRAFTDLVQDVVRALKTVHGDRPTRDKANPGKKP